MLEKINFNLSLLISRFLFSFQRRDNSIWVFGEWLGERCCDNCLYFANYVANSHPEIKLVWITKKETNTHALDESVECVEMDTPEAISYLKKAGVVFLVHGMPDLTQYNKIYYSGALVINFWHGMPWKKIQADMYNGFLKRLYSNYITKMTIGGLYLSLSKKYDAILKSAFACKNDDIIKYGYPRMSIFYNEDFVNKSKSNMINFIRGMSYDISSDTRIITYMPTFRKNDEKAFSFEHLLNQDRLKRLLHEYNAIIVQKTHFVSSHRKEVNNETDGNIIQIKEYPTQELLASTDILITDYSSCFFDYLMLDRPIIHYLYDFKYYENEDRGLYYQIDEVVCGDVATDESQLIEMVEKNLKGIDSNTDLREKRRTEFLEYESMHSCDYIYDSIIKRLE